MSRTIERMTSPITGWALSAALALGVLVSNLVPVQAPSEPTRSWTADQRLVPTQTPATQASGQIIASPQKWVF